jgi:hypothetical protein
LDKLAQKISRKVKSEQIEGGLFTQTAICGYLHTLTAIFIRTIAVTTDAIAQFEVLLFGLRGLKMVDNHARILHSQGKIGFVAANIVLYRAGNLLFILKKQVSIGKSGVFIPPG